MTQRRMYDHRALCSSLSSLCPRTHFPFFKFPFVVGTPHSHSHRGSRPQSSTQSLRLSPSSSLTLPDLGGVRSHTNRRSNGAFGAKTATAAASYTLTLADVAKANNSLDATASDIEKVEEVFSDPQMFDFFSNPTTIDIETSAR